MTAFAALSLGPLFAAERTFTVPFYAWVILGVVAVVLGSLFLCEFLGMRYIPNNRVGIVERLWSARGSVQEGRIIALNGEAGYQADLLRGGVHFGLWRWQYRIHRVSLVTVPQGKIGYVYARDGEPLPAGQTLGRFVECNNFQDARAFLGQGEEGVPVGQRGRQRAFLRAGGLRGRQYAVLTDGTYFINRWFATLEMQAKTVVPIGYVGVVVSYYGRAGEDISGETFRHGERVARGERGVWEVPLGPDK